MKIHPSLLLDPAPAVVEPTGADPASTPATPTPEVGVLEDPEMASVFENPFSSLDDKLKSKPKEPKVEPSDDKTKTDPKTVKPDAKVEKPKVEDKKVEPPAPIKGIPKELKAHNEQLVKEKRELEAKYRDLESRYAKAEAAGRDTSKLAEQIARKEEEIKAVRSELTAAKFTLSDDFKAKHEVPWKKATERAKQEIESLTVPVEKDENGAVIKTRPATWNDFYDLFSLPTGQALARARQIFGEDADVVKQILFDLKGRQQAWTDAIEDEKSGWQRKQQEAEATRIREQEAISNMWEKVNTDIVAKNPEWFGEDPEDPEGNELLKEGYRLVDSAYGENNLTPQQKVLLDAHIRNKAAAHGREVHRNARLQARIAELEEKLAGKKSTSPGSVRREGDSGQPSGETPILSDPDLAAAFQ